MSQGHRVVCVLSDGMTSIGVAVANDLFGAPWESVLGVPWYSYRTCSADPSPIRLGALRVNVEHGVSALSRADTVIIPSRGRRPPAPVLLAALQRAYRRGARMVSFCTGAYLLAEAGLLDGRPATTLWTHADRFRDRFPAVKLDPSVLYVDDGQVLTSAGNSAAADLALHILRTDHGAAIANRVARQMVAAPHRSGGQAQYVETPVSTSVQPGDQFAAVMEWAGAAARAAAADPAARRPLLAQPAPVHPAFPRVHGHDAAPMAADPAPCPGAAAARNDRPARRPGSCERRLWHARGAAAAVPEGTGHQPGSVSPHVPPVRSAASLCAVGSTAMHGLVEGAGRARHYSPAA